MIRQWFLFGVWGFIFAFGASMTSAQSNTRVIYYEKSADQGRFDAVRGRITSLLSAKIFTVSPNRYYEENGLATNALVCGEDTAPEDVKQVAKLLIEQGFNLLYIGPYRQAEINSSRDAIDIRSVGRKEFYGWYWPIKTTDLDNAQIACGVDNSMKTGLFGAERN